MKIHRFPTFHSVRSLCNRTYTEICDLHDAYIVSDIDEKRFPVTCPECLAKSSLRPFPAQPEAARPSPPAPMVGDKADGLRFFTGREDSALGSAASHIVALGTLEVTGSDTVTSSVGSQAWRRP